MTRFHHFPNHHNAYPLYRLPIPRVHQLLPLSSKNQPNRRKQSLVLPSYVHDQAQNSHIENDYRGPPGVGGAIDMSLLYQADLFLTVAWNRPGEVPEAKIGPARYEYVTVSYAGNAIGRNANQSPGELSVRAKGSAKTVLLDAVTVTTCCSVVPYPVGDAVVFSPIYHSGVPCLSAFRFPAPQNGADVAPISLIVLHCFAERGFNPFCRIHVGSIFQFIC